MSNDLMTNEFKGFHPQPWSLGNMVASYESRVLGRELSVLPRNSRLMTRDSSRGIPC